LERVKDRRIINQIRLLRRKKRGKFALRGELSIKLPTVIAEFK